MSTTSPCAIPRACLIAVVATTGCNSLIGTEEVSLASPDAAQTTPAAACDVASEFGLVVSNPTTSVLSRRDDGGPDLLFLLNTHTKPDSLGVSLWDNMGGHGAVTVPGSYSLTEADSKWESCGVCVLVYADYDRATNQFLKTYMARAQGTMQIDRADTSGMAGRFRNLTFRHVDLASGSTVEVEDGCSVEITDVRFDLSYAP